MMNINVEAPKSDLLVEKSRVRIKELRRMDHQSIIAERARKAPTLKVGSVTIRFEPEELDELYTEKAATELRETPDVVKQALAEIRQLVKAEPDLNVPDEDTFYTKFLRPCKWYAKPAFNLMKRFYQYRLSHPRYCDALLPVNERAILSSGVITPLPYRCKDGERVLLVEGGKRWKPKEISLDQIFRGVMLSLDAALAEPKTQVAGCRVLLDMDGLSLTHVTYFTPTFAAAVLEWVQKCLPTRLKGVHIVNQPFIFNMVFAIFKPFLQEKLRKRVIFHGTDRNSLMKYIDAKALPTRYGGEVEMPSEPIGEPLWQYFCNFQDDFQMTGSYGYTKKT